MYRGIFDEYCIAYVLMIETFHKIVRIRNDKK